MAPQRASPILATLIYWCRRECQGPTHSTDCSNSRRRLRARVAIGCTPRWRAHFARTLKASTCADQPRGQPAAYARSRSSPTARPSLTTNMLLRARPARRCCVARSCITRLAREGFRTLAGLSAAISACRSPANDGAVLGHLCAFGQDRAATDAAPANDLRNPGGTRFRRAAAPARRAIAARQREPHGTRARRVARAASPSARPGRDHRREPGAPARPRDGEPRRAHGCDRAHQRRDRAPARSFSRAPSMRPAAGPTAPS